MFANAVRRYFVMCVCMCVCVCGGVVAINCIVHLLSGLLTETYRGDACEDTLVVSLDHLQRAAMTSERARNTRGGAVVHARP